MGQGKRRILLLSLVGSMLLSGCSTVRGARAVAPGSNGSSSAGVGSAVAAGEAASKLPAVQAFIARMARKHDFDPHRLQQLFSRVRLQPQVIARITRPAEKSKPWYEYRAIFLGQRRIRGGVAFWRQHAAALHRATKVYGVPLQIIVAIIGVETRYGAFTGKDSVLDALTTLAFAYPPRAHFFRSELEHFLLLTRAEHIDPLRLQGSYAGAMGLPQFMPSSYQAYAVDFDGDGRRDLWHDPVDAIGSVAHYLSAHGWRRGEPVVAAARVTGTAYPALVNQALKPQLTVRTLRRRGIAPQRSVAGSLKAVLLQLQGRSGPQYWLGFSNFYVITRYNQSPLYAMAVVELARAIRNDYKA